ncbi:MAG: DUF3240 family protein [Hyphomicrobium sp.]
MSIDIPNLGLDPALCKLTFVLPPSGADYLTEVLLTLDPPLAGFTTWTAEGHGHGFANANISERVRGRVRRTVLAAILPRQNVAQLLEHLRTAAAIPHLTYWVEPVELFGQLLNQERSNSTEPLNARESQ